MTAAFSRGRAVGDEGHRGDEPRLLLAGRDHRDGLVGDLRRRLRVITTLPLFDEHDDLLGRDRVDPARMSYVDGFIVAPPSSVSHPSEWYIAVRPGPDTIASAPQCWPSATGAPVRRAVRSATCVCMSATSSRETSPSPSKTPVTAWGSSVWTWTRSVTWSPTTSTESPSASSRPM